MKKVVLKEIVVFLVLLAAWVLLAQWEALAMRTFLYFWPLYWAKIGLYLLIGFALGYLLLGGRSVRLSKLHFIISAVFLLLFVVVQLLVFQPGWINVLPEMLVYGFKMHWGALQYLLALFVGVNLACAIWGGFLPEREVE